jgi:thiosulfate/3-mercaptopyruvate sulfurtransferase
MLKPVLFAVSIAVGVVTSAVPFSAISQSAKPAATATATPVVSASDLNQYIAQKNVRILDIRSPQEYAAGHIPGAVNTPYGDFRGPKENAGALRPAAEITNVLRKAGVAQGQHIIVAHAGKDGTDFGAAARVYWTLKAGGLTNLSVLDGGTLGWAASGGKLDTAKVDVAPSQFNYVYNEDMIVHTNALAALIKEEKSVRLLDARPEGFFKGEKRVDMAARYGTLPGAESLDFAEFFGSDGKTLKSPEQLRQLVKAQKLDSGEVVSFCNTGHWAATNWFIVSEIAGNANVKLYPESVVEWSKTDLPMENQPSRVKALLQDARR